MIKIIDLDRLFDKYIEKYVYENVGKVKPEEIENEIPVLYAKFGDETLSELDGATPNSYYRKFGAEGLLNTLKEHIERGVSVSDFLCEAITADKDCEKAVKNELLKENPAEYTAYLMNFLADINGDIPIGRYLEFALFDYPEEIGELATEFLGKNADKAKSAVLTALSDAAEDKKSRLYEILSCVKEREDAVFDALVAGFFKHAGEIPLYSSFLARYGDERAIPFLSAAADGDVNYADFEELRFAIEALGGEYKGKKDFSADKIYKKIKGDDK